MVEMEDAHIEGNVTTASKLWSTFFKPVLYLVPAWTVLITPVWYKLVLH